MTPPDGQAIHARGRGLSADAPLPREGEFQWVTLWGFPLRVMHWVAALAIVVLVVTGLYIGRPYFATSGFAIDHYLMGWFRFSHYIAAALLVMTGLVRVYWLAAGNKYERFSALFPLKPRDWVNGMKYAKAYATFNPHAAPPYLGHHPMQQMSYTGIYVLALVQVITGFILYVQADPHSAFFKAFDWMTPLLGGLQMVRFIHHVLTWAFCAFIPLHIYLAVRADWLEHGGIISSIITGGKFVEAKLEYEDA